jgi:hypothetical protein
VDMLGSPRDGMLPSLERRELACYRCTTRGPASSKCGFEALEIRLLEN